MTNRKFIKDVYDKYDSKSKEVIADYFIRQGFIIVSDKEVYNYDLGIKDTNGFIYRLELEHRMTFKGKEFSFDTVHIPYRKKKNIAHFYLVINNDYTYFLTTKMRNIKESNIINIFCMGRPLKEDFYDVPIGLWLLIEIKKPQIFKN